MKSTIVTILSMVLLLSCFSVQSDSYYTIEIETKSRVTGSIITNGTEITIIDTSKDRVYRIEGAESLKANVAKEVDDSLAIELTVKEVAISGFSKYILFLFQTIKSCNR